MVGVISLKTIPRSVFKIARYFDPVELKPAAEGLPVQIRQIIKSQTKTKTTAAAGAKPHL